MPLSRASKPRRYLMCPPRHFDVNYSINPWMDPTKPVDTGVAVTQWERLRDVYLSLGHQVELIDPVPGLPDMVFAANGGTVVDGRVFAARFRYPQRFAEAKAYLDWFVGRGYQHVHEPEWVNEGEGDYLFDGRRLLAGTGFRTDLNSHGEVQEVFGRQVVSLRLVDPRFYHLDTALAVLDVGEVMYYPAAFSPGSQRVLRDLYPDAILAADADADAFGLNAVSDGRHVVLPQTAIGLIDQLRSRGFEPIGVDLSELHKSGGAVKCCTLELRD
ncbi:MAG TPA: arginine deiminase-related protein [Pseudonocardiaceae bacterium]|nr:arginine deiminase-related protein [Pseudonocardiaceae bacterium]